MTDQTSSSEIVGAISVIFRSPSHRDLHELLTEHDFVFEVTPSRHQVGLLYRHETRAFEVLLSPDFEGGDYRAAIFDMRKPLGEQVICEDSYTTSELDWIEGSKDERGFLERELQVLFHGLPAFLNNNQENVKG